MCSKALLGIPNEVIGQQAFDQIEAWMENPLPIKVVARFRMIAAKSVGIC